MYSSLTEGWLLNSSVTIYLVEHLPDEVWSARMPGYNQKTVRMVGAHLHNCRGMWVKMLGERFGVSAAPKVDRHRVSRSELAKALVHSGESMAQLLEASLGAGGKMTGFSPPDVHFFAAYIATHEGHHRGQMAMAARQLGHPLSNEVMAGMWQWAKRRSR